MEPQESRPQFILGQRRLTLEAEHKQTHCSYSGFLLSLAKSRFMRKSAKFGVLPLPSLGPQWKAPHLRLVRLSGSLRCKSRKRIEEEIQSVP